MGTKKIVITGAPGTGKTVVVDALENKGYYCYPEIIREMTAAEKKGTTNKTIATNPLVFVDDPLQFNHKLLEGRIAHFKAAKALSDSVCFFDRGIPDVLAYMDYFDQTYPPEFVQACKAHRYQQIFLLPPWEEIFASDNERMENFDQAVELHNHLFETYSKFDYAVTMLPKASIEERVALILETIN